MFLVISCSFYFSQVVQLLLMNRSEVDAADKLSSTPLFLAVSCGSLELFELLLAHGAQAGQPSRHRLTPLMLAIIKGHTSICVRLANIEGICGERAPRLSAALAAKSYFQLSVQRGYTAVSRVLIAAGCDLSEESDWLYNEDQRRHCCRNSEEMIQFLLHMVRHPFSLRHQARRAIRRAIGRDFDSSVEQLGAYPTTLKEYILLQDLMSSSVTQPVERRTAMRGVSGSNPHEGDA